jgi:MerR family transcriptional regulator, heat shock protein HspR
MSTDRPILTISIAAKLLGVHPRTLMLYEHEGVFSSHRTETKRRMFSIDDLNQLQFIKFLTQEIGLNLQGVKTFFLAMDVAGKADIDLKKELFPQFSAKQLI